MRGQQLAEELLLRRVRPADQCQARVQVLHQPGQLHQEALAHRQRALGLHAHHQFDAHLAKPPGLCRVDPLAPRRQHQRLTPDLRQEVAHVGVHGHRCQRLLQLKQVALLNAQFRLLAFEQTGRAIALGLAVALACNEGFERSEFGGVEVDLVEVALDDFLHQFAHTFEKLFAGAVVEIVESTGQRGDAVDEAPHRMPARREETGIDQRHAKNRQLQARDLARHLRRHAAVGQDLVEQAADHVDHHVVELAGGGLQQFFAVRADQVDGHQAAHVLAVADPRAGAAAQRDGAGVLTTCKAGAGAGMLTDLVVSTATRGTEAAARARPARPMQIARPAGQEGQPAQQIHQLGVGAGV